MDQSWQVFLVSIWDVRVAMPLALVLGFKPWQAFLMASSGALVIAPFLLLFRELLALASRRAPGLVNWVLRLNQKYHAHIEKYGYWGLFVFVAVPIPGTGAWTGAIAAGFLQMDVWKSFFVILVGIVVSGLLTTLFASIFVP